MKRLIWTILVLLSAAWLQAQDSKPVQDIIQQLIEHVNEDQNIFQLHEDLEALQQNPINLNTATQNDLQQLFFLDDRQINSLLRYRKLHGNFLSIYELQGVPHLDELVIEYLLPFTCIKATHAQTKRYFSLEGYQRASTYLEKAKGYKGDSLGQSAYNGSPIQLLSKFSAHYGSKVESHLVFEKDRGETAINPKTNKPEFLSASLGIKDVAIFDHLVIGDYKLYLGQGLIASTDRFMGKSMPFDGIAQRYNTFVPYRSSGEANYFRGAAFSTHWKQLQLHTFGSSRKKDAALDTLSDGHIVFNNFNSTGLHRTQSEIANYHSINETVAGLKVGYDNNFLSLSAYSFNSFFDRQLITYDRPDTKNLFNGTTLRYAGFSWRTSMGNISLFGELANDTQNNTAVITGANLYPNDFTSCQVIYRYYPYNYFSLYGSAFGENNTRNEEGYFIKLITSPIAKTTFTGYIDMFHFPGIKFGEVAPTKGQSVFLRIDYTPNSNTSVYMRLKYDTKETNVSKSAFDSKNMFWKRWQSYLQLTSLICPKVKLKTKVGYVNYKLKESSTGVLFLQDISWHFNQKGLLNARFAVFETDDYSSRLYAYESDVLYYFAIPAYAGKGQRIYLTGRYKFSKHFTLEAKLGRYTYWNKEEIGGGNDLIRGHKKTDVKIQLRWRL